MRADSREKMAKGFAEPRSGCIEDALSENGLKDSKSMNMNPLFAKQSTGSLKINKQKIRK